METVFLLKVLCTRDYDFKIWAKAELGKRYGAQVANYLYQGVNANEDNERKEVYKNLIGVETMRSEEIVELILCLQRVYGDPRFSISEITDMYKSEDPFLIMKAKEYIVLNYQRFVYDIVHKGYPTYNESYKAEMINAGLMGLIFALKNYTEDRGKFTTYSKLFIRHEINSFINAQNNNTTVHYTAIHKKITEAISELTNQGYEATIDNIAIMTDLKTEVVQRELDYLTRTQFVYLDDLVEEPSEMSDYTSSPESIFLDNEKYVCLYNCIDALPPKIREVVIYKTYTEMTHEEIANKTGLTTSQVRNCFQKGLEMLRRNEELEENYSGYFSTAEKELSRYRIPVIPTKRQLDQEMEEILSLPEE